MAAHILVCFLACVLWKTLGQICDKAGAGSEPRRVLAELSELRMMDVVLPTRDGIDLRPAAQLPSPARKSGIARLPEGQNSTGRRSRSGSAASSTASVDQEPCGSGWRFSWKQILTLTRRSNGRCDRRSRVFDMVSPQKWVKFRSHGTRMAALTHGRIVEIRLTDRLLPECRIPSASTRWPELDHLSVAKLAKNRLAKTLIKECRGGSKTSRERSTLTQFNRP